MSQVKEEPRWSMIDNNTWDMILGKSGKLPGALAPEIIELAKEKGLQFTDEDPQTNFPDQLDAYRAEMKENGWESGEDDEELFELAMHDRQYRDYKSGVAKKRFEEELQRAKDAALASKGFSEEEVRKFKRSKAEPITALEKGRVIWEIDVESASLAPSVGKVYNPEETFCYISTPWGTHDKMLANFKGRIIEVCAKQGSMVNKGDVLAYIERTDLAS